MARIIKKRQASGQTAMSLNAECTALYIRVSTDKQADEGFSLAAQQERLQAHCVAQGWAVSPEHVYIDAGVSGTSTEKRTEYQRMMNAARLGEIDRIVAMKLDRLARNVRDFLAIVDELKELDCGLVLVKESFDTSTPHGRFALTMFAAMAELEASTITERVMSGKEQKATEGGYNGSRCPLGYTYQDGQFKIEQSGAYWIREVFNRFNAGQGMSSIADELNNAGATTSRGGAWYASTVRYVLTNGFYAGLAQWNGKEIEGNHPAIITLDDYSSAIQRIENIKPGRVAK